MSHLETDTSSSPTGLEIAVIGMAGRFPGAANTDEFWNNLKNGVESISFFSDDELLEAGVEPQLVNNRNYVNACSYVEDAEYFDAAFFNYAPVEAQVMDPQLRLFHQCAWEALENAGCNPDIFDGPIGVYAGAATPPAWISGAVRQAGSLARQFDIYALNSSSSFGTRVAYNLNLKGPGLTVQTACSTSLVAIHLACQGLLNAECDIALAGGVSISSKGKSGYFYQEGMIVSPDGHCRAFDADAKGTLRGDGIGIVVLKRLEEALEDGDYIYAVIKGSAINNDGSRKIGYTAPSVEGQAEVIRAAQELAEVEAESITYIEAHGTGTALGDPIEIEGLKLAFDTDKRHFCGIGSVKTNIGHLDNAAGVTGFIKTVLALKNRKIPPSLHFKKPNPGIDFENSPFYVNSELRQWDNPDGPLRAGVSSFGIGGTNAHVVLEEAPAESQRNESEDKGGKKLFLLSARTEGALNRAKGNMAAHFESHGDLDAGDVAYTLQKGRKRFKYRGYTICATLEEAAGKMASQDPVDFNAAPSLEEDRKVVFLFPGQGAQYVEMGRGLYENVPFFREQMDGCFKILDSFVSTEIKEILYPKGSSENEFGDLNKKDINQTEYTQPLIFAIEYSLAKLLISWGIEPCAMIGHSIGEYAAACLAGVFTLEEAIELVVLRGRLMQQLPGGDMVSLRMTEKELLPLLEEFKEVSLAAVNGADNCVVSGPKEAVGAFTDKLKNLGKDCRPLLTSHAFHSSMMEPILEEFETKVAGFSLQEPEMPYISNVTGQWAGAAETVEPGYWRNHLRQAVRFFDGLSTLLKEEKNALLLEVGPGRVLSGLVRQHGGKGSLHSALNLLRHPKEEAADDAFLLEQLGQMWQRGVPVDWDGFYGETKKRVVPLPTYSFERLAFPLFWPAGADGGDVKEVEKAAKKLTKERDMSRWFVVPAWRSSRLSRQPMLNFSGGPEKEEKTWLVMADTCGLGEEIARRLRHEGQPVIMARQGVQFHTFHEENEPCFTLRPGAEEDYDLLFKELVSLGRMPFYIIHLWNVGSENDSQEDYLKKETHNGSASSEHRRSSKAVQSEAFGSPEPFSRKGFWPPEALMDRTFHGLLYMARALGRNKPESSIEITVISDNLHDVTGDGNGNPAKALLLGPVQVIPREYSFLRCRSIDIQLPAEGELFGLVENLLAECLKNDHNKKDNILALQENRRWVREYEPFSIGETAGRNLPLKEKGVYLVTGGLGGIGLTMAKELAEKWQARLILTGLDEFPERNQWDQWLKDHAHQPGDPVSLQVRQLRQMEKMGAEVIVCRADVSDFKQMSAAVTKGKEIFGPVNGVIHSAGMPDGGLIQVRTKEQSEAVLAPKVAGTLILDQLLAEEPLDFFFLCSSLSSVLAPMGQVAYCSANGFLDAFALSRASHGETLTISVSWDGWKEVGMAVAAMEKLTGTAGLSLSHPLLHRWFKEGDGKETYLSYLSAESCWVLDEHRIQGRATLPGTAYLEMAGAAFENHWGSGAFEIKNCTFLTPLTLQNGELRTVHTTLQKEKNNENYSFSISSSVNGKLLEHARGSIAALPDKNVEMEKQTIAGIKDKCNSGEIAAKKPSTESSLSFISAGPRWDHFLGAQLGDREGLASLELPASFHPDLESFRLHPALMDTGTAFLTGQYSGGKAFLPFLMKTVRVLGQVPGKLYSHARAISVPDGDSEKSGRQNLVFDITLMDENGCPVVEVDGFTALPVTTGEKAETKSETAAEDKGERQQQEEGILPSEGVEVLNRLLCEGQPHVLVSTINFHERLARLAAAREAGDKKGNEDESKEKKTKTAAPAHPRPELSTPYSPPVNNVQEGLADIWQEFLGIGGIGILDDFFELGGDSLKGLSVSAEIQKQFNVDISITDIFASPTIEGLSKQIGGPGSPAESQKSRYDAILPVEEREYYPVSSAQQRLFFLQQRQKENLFYNIPQMKLIEGDLDAKQFEKAVRGIIDRHEGLRTTLHLIEGEAAQRVHRDVSFEMEYRDCSDKTFEQADLEEMVRTFIRPFHLDKFPLLRCGLLKLEDKKHLWMFDIHHIAADATAYAILENDLFALYKGEELPPLKIRYKDFASWQHDRMASGAVKDQEDYWMDVYSDIHHIRRAELPTDFSRPEISTFAGDLYLFRSGKEDAAAFTKMASDIGVTFYFKIMAVLNVLLFKYTGLEDVIVGSSIAGRPHADLQQIVGMFVNMLAIRNRPTADVSFKQLLETVKKNCINAFENQDMQFDILVDQLNLDMTTGRNPLFDICLNVMNYQEAKKPSEDLKLSPFGFEYKNSKFDMVLWAGEAEELRFQLEYSTELFKPSTAKDFANHLLEIISQVAANPQIKLKDIKISHNVKKAEVEVPDIDFGF